MKVIVLVSVFLCFSSSVHALDCTYWWGKADPEIKTDGPAIDETVSANVIAGIECLLKLEGRKRRGIRFGSKPEVSQRVPMASVEVNALYTISELFYGSDAFATAVALIGVPPQLSGEFGTLVFNSDEDTAKAFRSYRKWFQRVKEIGLKESRHCRLDPLANSGVRWY
ncbi:MAG: hypothetical protein K1X52_03500 [Pyrinomonadaceae bacterium]|nr:hypothetical protein [Pyrinomonadaceae bacterium]